MSENNRLSEDGDAGYGRWRQDTEELRRDHVLLPFTLGRMLITMWRSLFIVFLLAGMGARSSAESVDYRDFAINTYYPKPNEVRVAEERTRQYWAKSAGRYGSHPVYLAVETSKVFESESVQNLYAKLLYSGTRASSFGRSVGRHRGQVDLKGIMIFDIRTGRFVSARGYVSVDKPPRGRVVRFGSYIARYIGTGRGGLPDPLRLPVTISAISRTCRVQSSGRWRRDDYTYTSLQFAKASDLLRPIVTLLWKPLGRQENG